MFGRKSLCEEDLGGRGGDRNDCVGLQTMFLTAICLFSMKMCERVNRGGAGGCDEMIDSSGR